MTDLVHQRATSSPSGANRPVRRRHLLAGLALAATVAVASDGDPTVTDPDKYRTILENDRVRVLEYRDEPGARTAEHHHPPFVLYALSGFEREVTLPDGKRLIREFEPGDVMWSEAQTHIGHNVGSTGTHVILVELK